MPAVARTFSLIGVEAREVRVEADVRNGLPAFALVGLPDAAVRESRERVRAALVNSGFEFPQKRITANLAPADLRKAGPGFDLAIAAAVLAATAQLPDAVLADVALVGELALDGSIRPVPGTMAMAEAATRAGARAIVVPAACAAEAALIEGAHVVPVERLEQLRSLGGEHEPPGARAARPSLNGAGLPDLADLRGQPGLRHGLEVAAAGGHSLLMTGPPGAGKSMAARRLPSIMPPLGPSGAIEAARVASACGRPVGPAVAGRRPFRAPHHTISTAGLIGGGNPPRPGEVTLAHHGVLFLDELPEFGRGALEALRQPLEDGRVRIARARYAVELPCRFQLVAAANPCPCGCGPRSGSCTCDPASVRAYEAKLTGALADRIDVSFAVEQPDLTSFGEPGEASAGVRDRVLAARERQRARIGDERANGELDASEIKIGAEVERMLAEAGSAASLSGRGRERVIRLARTVADLDGAQAIGIEHIGGALSLRRRDFVKPAPPVWEIEPGADEYPDCLRDLDQRERPRLYGCGRRDAVAGLDRHSAVTIVGTRRPSAYGLRIAEQLARELAAAGVTIVSGMARGIDGAAHRGALAGAGTTIAVLANGPDVVYPPVNRALYERIVETGAAISEHPAGAVARRHHFPERNRIMAALGGAVLIVEAAQPSGTMITADRALRLGRSLGAVPGQLGVRVAAGSNDLIRDGAYLIRDARDVLDLLYGVGGAPRPAPKPRPGPPLDERLGSILDRVRSGAATVDRIALEAELEPRETTVGLARLELLGYVAADALGGYSATNLARP